MEEIVFEKKVSKGSKFNQIYIPKEMESIVEVGDLVQIKLLEKHKALYYKNQKKLPDFKEYLINKEILICKSKFNYYILIRKQIPLPPPLDQYKEKDR